METPESYLMHGPHADTGEVVEEYVPAGNVAAYKGVGWAFGSIPPPEPESKPLETYADPVESVPVFHTMHGPDLDTGETVEAEVADENVHAYRSAGWEMGPIEAVVYTEDDAIEQNDGKDEAKTRKKHK